MAHIAKYVALYIQAEPWSLGDYDYTGDRPSSMAGEGERARQLQQQDWDRSLKLIVSGAGICSYVFSDTGNFAELPAGL